MTPSFSVSHSYYDLTEEGVVRYVEQLVPTQLRPHNMPHQHVEAGQEHTVRFADDVAYLRTVHASAGNLQQLTSNSEDSETEEDGQGTKLDDSHETVIPAEFANKPVGHNISRVECVEYAKPPALFTPMQRSDGIRRVCPVRCDFHQHMDSAFAKAVAKADSTDGKPFAKRSKSVTSSEVGNNESYESADTFVFHYTQEEDSD